MEPDVLLADGAPTFIDAVETALRRLSPEDSSRRMQLASRNSWETRTERLLSLIQRELTA
jgi:hypothetical protein